MEFPQLFIHKHIRSFEEKINNKPQIAEQFFSNFGSNKSCDIQLCESSITIFCQSLIQWALKGKTQGNGYGFPFDRPYLIFYQRLIVVYNSLSEVSKSSLPNNPKYVWNLVLGIWNLKRNPPACKLEELFSGHK